MNCAQVSGFQVFLLGAWLPKAWALSTEILWFVKFDWRMKLV
jgi:hypothetical protein